MAPKSQCQCQVNLFEYLNMNSREITTKHDYRMEDKKHICYVLKNQYPIAIFMVNI